MEQEMLICVGKAQGPAEEAAAALIWAPAVKSSVQFP